MQTDVQHKWFFSQPPQEVWDYLTKPELIEQWLMKNDFMPVIGYDFQFSANPLPDFDFDGIVYCKVLEIVPFKRLSYSWKSGPGNGRITLDSVVVWTLHPKDNGTELLLHHSGFKEADFKIYPLINQGWLKNIQKIAGLINNAKHDTTNT
jgi:uncharacterized protein YndB with AHSA1/START domain